MPQPDGPAIPDPDEPPGTPPANPDDWRPTA
jgi:hypothetical protein